MFSCVPLHTPSYAYLYDAAWFFVEYPVGNIGWESFGSNNPEHVLAKINSLKSDGVRNYVTNTDAA